MQTEEIGDKASAMMPDLLDKLERLVAIPSVAFPGYPGDPVRRMGEVTLELFREGTGTPWTWDRPLWFGCAAPRRHRCTGRNAGEAHMVDPPQ